MSRLAPAHAPSLSQSEQDAFVTLMSRCYFRPGLFAREVLGVQLRTWQKRFCRRISEKLLAGDRRVRALVRTCHGAGKTMQLATLVLWFMSTRPHARGLTTAPSWAGVENLLWPEIAKLYNGSLLRQLGFGRLLSTSIEFDDAGWYCVGAASDRPEKLEGHHSPTAAMRAIDECKAVPPEVITATKGMLTCPEAFDIWISTPALQTGPFFDLDSDPNEPVIREHVTVDDLISDPLIASKDRQAYADWKAECAREWGEQSAEYRSRVMAEYVDSAEGALFPVSWVEAAFRRTPNETEAAALANAKPVAGTDVAGSVDGDETAVAVVRHTDELTDVESIASWKVRDTMQTKDRAKLIATDAGAALRVDCLGLGQGVYDQASAEGFDTEEFRASEKPRQPERFTNRKAEEAWAFRQRLEKGQVSLARIPLEQRQKLKGQFAGMKYEITTAGKLKVVDPSDSPDLVDAILIGSASSRPGIVSADVSWL